MKASRHKCSGTSLYPGPPQPASSQFHLRSAGLALSAPPYSDRPLPALTLNQHRHGSNSDCQDHLLPNNRQRKVRVHLPVRAVASPPQHCETGSPAVRECLLTVSVSQIRRRGTPASARGFPPDEPVSRCNSGVWLHDVGAADGD